MKIFLSIYSSPKYTLLWYIPMLDIQWTIPQTSSNDKTDTGGMLEKKKEVSFSLKQKISFFIKVV